MPIKPMKCQACGHSWEWWKLSSKELPQCEKCLSPDVIEEYPTRGGFSLKGKGWFKSGGY